MLLHRIQGVRSCRTSHHRGYGSGNAAVLEKQGISLDQSVTVTY